MKRLFLILSTVPILFLGMSCASNTQNEEWQINSQQEWQEHMAEKSNLDIFEGKLVPTSSDAIFQSSIKQFDKKRSVNSISLSQSTDWLNWESVSNIGPSNLRDAPVALQLGEGNYWMFGKYGKSKNQKEGTFQAVDTTLEGYDIPLKSTPFKNQFDAAGGLKPGLGGYHAWQSKDMHNWVHHGPVSEYVSRWMTTAEYADGKVYLYYDFPNDQDPHLYIDEDLTDGEPGKNMGMVFKDSSHGSDCAVIRDLDGNFNLIVEDWTPIHAASRAWDSPLAIHAQSPDGINDFKILDPSVDERTEPTGEIGTYEHPHWKNEDPKNYPTNVAEYEIHSPEQNAFGDWASISIGGQYYLFSDYDKAGKHGWNNMSVAWFTSDDINKPFSFCSSIGQGHPDPDIIFAEGKFHMLTQTKFDYISPGPWVETVEVRVGVDTKNDGIIDKWSAWQIVSEQYDYIEGFAKQVERIPAQMDLSDLPKGFGFQFEIKVSDATENESKPVIDEVVLSFGDK